MARLAGVHIPDNKKIEIALTYIYGIGPSLSRRILRDAGIDADRRTSELQPDELNKLKEKIEGHYKIEGELRRELLMNIKRLKDVGTWRGLRHMKRLPVRGQRTKTNTRTVRGNVRKTVTSGRKPPPSPT
ncbi:MAG: 30S ribosomal protein S13 [Candidatus Wildermuthbacteria bacterium]|nr:30S ribosomal protein S13 [Candidatus Wildermuthbacteria bacterium]